MNWLFVLKSSFVIGTNFWLSIDKGMGNINFKEKSCATGKCLWRLKTMTVVGKYGLFSSWNHCFRQQYLFLWIYDYMKHDGSRTVSVFSRVLYWVILLNVSLGNTKRFSTPPSKELLRNYNSFVSFAIHYKVKLPVQWYIFYIFSRKKKHWIIESYKRAHMWGSGSVSRAVS